MKDCDPLIVIVVPFSALLGMVATNAWLNILQVGAVIRDFASLAGGSAGRRVAAGRHLRDLHRDGTFVVAAKAV